jgi:hypothetical protein
LRNLNVINTVGRSTGFIFRLSLFFPVFTGLVGFIFAIDCAPNLPVAKNYLALSGIFMAIIALTLLPVPSIFKWDWNSKYYGASLFGFATVACMGIYPLLCIALYSRLPLWSRVALVLAEAIIILLWCFRFLKIYRYIYSDEELFNTIYFDDGSVVYFLQQGDKQLLEKKLRFEQSPPGWSFAASSALSLCFTLFYSNVVHYVGLPFTHIILTILSVPVTLLVLGLATKMWLIHFTYPRKIRLKSGKSTYVDMVSKPPLAHST